MLIYIPFYWIVTAVALFGLTRRHYAGDGHFAGSVILAFLWPVTLLCLVYFAAKAKVLHTPLDFRHEGIEVDLVFAGACLIVAAFAYTFLLRGA